MTQKALGSAQMGAILNSKVLRDPLVLSAHTHRQMISSSLDKIDSAEHLTHALILGRVAQFHYTTGTNTLHIRAYYVRGVEANCLHLELGGGEFSPCRGDL